MTQTPNDVQVEAAAEAMWREEVAEIGAARRARESSYWADQDEEGKAKWRRLARAALTAALATSADAGEVVGRPASFAGWKDQLTRLSGLLTSPADIDAAQSMIEEMLEGFDDVVETEAILSALPPPEQALAERVEEMVERMARAEYTRVCLPTVMPEHRERVLDHEWRFFEADARRWLNAALNPPVKP